MEYENFSRHLRKKYYTRVHIAEQIIDQLKYNNQQQISMTSVHNKNMIKAQQEISYLNKFEYDKQNSNENNKQLEPYFNECLLAAERIKNNRRSDRDRQICYENFILAQKLERIKTQSGQNARINLEKDYQNHCRLLISKANCNHNTNKLINKRFTTKQFLLSNEKG
ncbi:unnamed protein product [Rotaria sordida]|uniref:Uncharacterized protein n=1 Tax=Rotaria sordida TaxID=392033 RepID=A0A815IP62_9BILA|nr:unnamed protein product [Rotaria sordida]CAF1371212.1 unnamed protein product [Rotaria sordida]CAF1611748.1 unnamed protein product [Rotaria sordida]